MAGASESAPVGGCGGGTLSTTTSSAAAGAGFLRQRFRVQYLAEAKKKKIGTLKWFAANDFHFDSNNVIENYVCFHSEMPFQHLQTV
jgi:hypothetical protein